MNELLIIFARMVIELGHWLGVVYIPSIDAPKNIMGAERPQPATQKPATAPEGLRGREYGTTEPGEQAKVILQIENFAQDQDGAEWQIQRYDGRGGRPDYSDIHPADYYVIRSYNMSDRQAESYFSARPLVVAGYSNTRIAEALGKSARWADEYAAKIREAFRLRAENPSPTAEVWLMAGVAPQSTAKQ